MPWATVVLAAVTVLLSLSGLSDGVTKLWTPNINFEDPSNWDADRVPSSVDVAVFQEDTAVPVVLPTIGVDVCELLFPVNGQLIMEPNAEVIISASSQDAGGCTGQTVKFKHNTPMEWVDPSNWWNENITTATPHMERIPCMHDTVKFIPDNSFSIIVPNVPINIGSIQYGNQTFDQHELDDFLLTDVGDQELKSSSPEYDVSITLTSTVCDDNTGCECGTQQLLDQVCKVASSHCHNNLGCITPVKPIGHCCWICGAYFLISYDPRAFIAHKFNEEFENDMAKIKSTYEEHQIVIHTGKLVNGKIQIVLASGTKYADEINEVAKTIHSILITYIGITDVKMFNSGLSFDVDGMTYGQITITTFTIIILSMFAIILYYTNNWKSLLSSSKSGAIFVKFENDTNDVELINDNTNLQRKSSFDNPTYGAMENLNQSQTFSGTLPHSDPSVSTIPKDTHTIGFMELKATSDQT